MNSTIKTVEILETGESIKYTKVEKKSGKRIGFNYIILRSLKESKKNDVVKCLYIKSLLDFGICVIKEGTYGDSKDKYGRDIKDRLIWQKQLHELLQDKVRIPRLLDSFEENGNYYLVMERIKGEPLYKIFKKAGRHLREGLIAKSKMGIRFLEYLIQIVDILHMMHMHHIVHRDVTLNNFMIMPNGKVAIIDMELSYSIANSFPTPPFQLGTIGYMSPEQEAIEIPTLKEDIFSIGAIMLQLWTGISPYKLMPANPDQVRSLVPDSLFAELISSCLDTDPFNRPSTENIKQFLIQYREDFRLKVMQSVALNSKITKDELMNTIQKGINSLGDPLMSDPEKGWFSEHMSEPSDEKNKIKKAWYASFNRGASGIIYFLSKAKNMGLNLSAVQHPIERGLELIKEKYINNVGRSSPGLHFGSDGIAVALATAIDSGLIEPRPEYIEWIKRLLQDTSDSEDMIKGVAGQGIANLLCAKYIPEKQLYERLESYAQWLIERQKEEGYWNKYSDNSKKRIIPGFGGGVAGITCYLLEFGHKYKHLPSLNAAERSLSWLMKDFIKAGEWKSFSKKALPYSVNEGVPGITMAFLRAYKYTQREVYKEMAISVMKEPIVVQNSWSQSFGISGVGEVLLEAGRELKDERFLEKADFIIRFFDHTRKNKNLNQYWLLEHERMPVANFMVGNSGIMHLLLRYTFPDKINFPLLP